jgi:hypothetical protein
MSRTAAAKQFAPHEFARLVDIAIQAGQQRPPVIATAEHSARNPYYNAALALHEEFRDDAPGFDSAMTRFVALMRLFTADRLGAWARRGDSNGQHSAIHPAVIHVAAQMTLNPNGRFPEKRFLEAVAEVAAASYPDITGWD